MPEISVIIPCFNERATIGKTIFAVSHELESSGFDYEIVVVDNGSTDGSDKIAKNYEIKYVYTDAYPIAAVRNIGVERAEGEIIVFLDADIVVQPSWGQAFRKVYSEMKVDSNFITGSQPYVPDDIQPLLYSWYKALSEDLRDTHLGTGHMIVSRDILNRLGGFDQSLITGEDFDFCLRAKKEGIIIISSPGLKVFHLGYPNTLVNFVKREIWHGSGACKNLNSLASSRVVCLGFFFVMLNISVIASLFFFTPVFFLLLVVSISIAIVSNVFKFGYGNMQDFFNRTIMSYLYLVGRGLSVPAYLIKRNKFYHWVHKKEF